MIKSGDALSRPPDGSTGRVAPERLVYALLVTGAVLVLTAVVWLLFAPVLDYEFINFDLYTQLVNNPKVRSLSAENLVTIFTSLSATSYYPVRLLSFAIDYRIGGGFDPMVYHRTSLLIHLANVLLLFGLALWVSRVVVTRRPTGSAGGTWWPLAIGATTALLFAVHPLVVEPVAWQGAREELLMLMFTLLCLLAHHAARVRYPQDGEPARSSWGVIVVLHVAAAICCAAACMSSAMGAAVPLVVVGYELSIPPAVRLKSILSSTGHLWLIALATVVAKILTHQEDLARSAPDVALWQRPLLVLQTYARNIQTFFWPRDLLLIYPRDVPTSPWAPAVLAGAGLVVATLVLLWLVRRRPLMLFGLLWMVFALGPSAQVLPHQHFQANRFLYSPLAGLCLAIVAGALAERRSRAVRIPLGVALLMLGVVLGGMSRFHLRHWRNNETLYTSCISVYPYHEFYTNRGLHYVEQNRFFKAVADFSEAIQLDPTRPTAYLNRANVYHKLGRYEKAAVDCSKSLDLDPDQPRVLAKRAHCYVELGRYGDARRDCNRVLELDPDPTSEENVKMMLRWLDRRERRR